MQTHQIRGFRSADQLMRDNMLVKHYAGSHAYGTALPTSDVDFRGVFCSDPVNVRTPFFPVRECEDTNEEDTKLYELAHFVSLCLDCNPNVIETLWVDRNDLTFVTPAYDHLRKYREQLLSSKIAYTTSGYALSQLKRIKGHNKWINNPQPVEPPRQLDYVSLVFNFTKKKLFNRDFHLKDYHNGYRLVPYGNDVYGLYQVDGYQTFNEDLCLNTNYDEEHDFHTITRQLFPDKRRMPLMVVKFNKQEYKQAKQTHSQYWEWKNNRNKARGELEEQFGYDCYSDDTEFLTDSGWKLFDEVSETDQLATFDQKTHKIMYQRPVERIDSTFTGNMYHFTGHHTDCFVTSNHFMYIRPFSRSSQKEGVWGLHRAAELPETFDTLTSLEPKANRQNLPETFPRSVLDEVSMLDFLRLIGWYISDGTMSFYEKGGVKSMRISQSKPQSKLTQTLTKQISYGKIECKHYLYENRGLGNYPENVWVFGQKISQTIFDQCKHGLSIKRLPGWCFELTKREMTTLLVALLQGDGSQRDHQKHTHVYYTSNNLLADDVQRLALLCGFETSLYGPYENMFHVHINMRPSIRRTNRQRVNVYPVKNKRIVCFMVPNHTLVTRRNGQIGLHGNTKHAMHLVRLLRMGVEALRDGVILVKRPDAKELLEIRNGAWTYEEIVEYAEHMDNQVRSNWYEKTSLPKKPDKKFAAKLVMDVQDIVWNNN